MRFVYLFLVLFSVKSFPYSLPLCFDGGLILLLPPKVKHATDCLWKSESHQSHTDVQDGRLLTISRELALEMDTLKHSEDLGSIRLALVDFYFR